MTAPTATARGGTWLVEDATGEVLTRESLNDEQRMIGQTAEQFVDSEVIPRIDDRPVSRSAGSNWRRPEKGCRLQTSCVSSLR